MGHEHGDPERGDTGRDDPRRAETGRGVTGRFEVARVLVPVGLAVATWLVALLAVGYLLGIRSLSPFTLLPLSIVVALFWPIVAVAPWREGASARVVFWIVRNRETLVGIVGLALLAALPVTPRLLVRILELPYRGSGIFFGASLFYREHVGPAFADLLLRFGQWYLELLWLYVVATGAVAVGRRMRLAIGRRVR